ncbi:MAG TPA: hypothetical protein PK322_04265 [Opitutaceae bacterium]|nr:hypothetical protein [Opitutaceae bacterium]
MPQKFAVDYRPFALRRGREFTRNAEERAEAEAMVMQLLTSGARIIAIRCNGETLTAPQFDRLLKASVARVVSGLLQASLALDAAQVHERFGYAA